MSFSYECKSCGQTHVGVPAFGADAPSFYYAMPEAERAERCILESDVLVLDEEHFFIRGRIEIPVHDPAVEPFVWLVWVSLSEESFREWISCYDDAVRSHIGPFFGWLSTALPLYPETTSLKTMVHLQDNWIRPSVVVEAGDHPLAVEQRNGISLARLQDMATALLHPGSAPDPDSSETA